MAEVDEATRRLVFAFTGKTVDEYLRCLIEKYNRELDEEEKIS